MTHMIDVIVEELESPDSNDGTVGADPIPYRHYTLVMKSLKQPASTYLLIDSKEEKVPSFVLVMQHFLQWYTMEYPMSNLYFLGIHTSLCIPRKSIA